MRRLLLTLLLLPSLAFGQSAAQRLSQVGSVLNTGSPAASTLGGTETIPCVQGGVTSACTPAQIKTYVGAASAATFQQNGTNLSNQTTINFENSAATNGLTLTFANPSLGNLQLGLTGTLSTAGGGTGNTSGLAAGLTGTPTNGQFWGYNGTAQGWYTPTGSGTVNSGTSGQIGCYAATGTAISGCNLANGLSISSNTLGISEAVNPQTGTTYTVASTDCGKQITFNNAAAIAVTVPQATGSFASCQFDVTDIGAGTATLTPTTSTINGSASLAVAQNRQCSVNSDGTNWQVIGCTALVSGGTGTSVNAIGFTASSVAQATTTGISPSFDGAVANYGALSPTSGTMKNLYLRTQNAPASGQTFAFTLFIGTAGSPTSTAVTCTISNPNTTCSDTTDTAAITAGQQWAIQVVTGATSGSTGGIMVGVELDH